MTLLAEVATGWVSHFATVLGLDRTSWYRQPTTQANRDAEVGGLLLTAHSDHPRYGVRRLGWFLGWSAHKTRRMMQVVDLVIARRKKAWRKGGKAEITAPANALRPYAVFKDEARPQDGLDYAGMVTSGAWVQDFTHLWFLGAWHYLAVVLDLETRQVLGWQLGLRHTNELTFQAVLHALVNQPAPPILHSDQGSEYLSAKHGELCVALGIVLSASDKGSPWQNGFMESWFGKFKDDLGPLTPYQDVAELYEAVARQIHYYNHDRIHSAFKMSPAAYAAELKKAPAAGLGVSDKVLQKVGA